MTTLTRFLRGELVEGWLDKKFGKASGFRLASRIGAQRAFVRIGRFNEEQGYARPWERAYREASQLQRQGALDQVNLFSFPSNAFKYAWLRQGKA